MNERLDELIRQSGLTATDRDLGGLETLVGRDIDRLAAQRRTAAAMGPVGAASVVLAAAIGLAAGVAAPVAPTPKAGAFVTAALAPSSLLGE